VINSTILNLVKLRLKNPLKARQLQKVLDSSREMMRKKMLNQKLKKKRKMPKMRRKMLKMRRKMPKTRKKMKRKMIRKRKKRMTKRKIRKKVMRRKMIKKKIRKKTKKMIRKTTRKRIRKKERKVMKRKKMVKRRKRKRKIKSQVRLLGKITMVAKTTSGKPLMETVLSKLRASLKSTRKISLNQELNQTFMISFTIKLRHLTGKEDQSPITTMDMMHQLHTGDLSSKPNSSVTQKELTFLTQSPTKLMPMETPLMEVSKSEEPLSTTRKPVSGWEKIQ
jgi:hypothetical protein